MNTWVRTGWVLISHGAMGACWVAGDQQWRHVCVGWGLSSSGDMGVSWVGADQPWRHACVLGGR